MGIIGGLPLINANVHSRNPEDSMVILFDERKMELEQNPQLTILIKIFTRQLNFSEQEIQYLATDQKCKLYFDFFDEVSSCWGGMCPVF